MKRFVFLLPLMLLCQTGAAQGVVSAMQWQKFSERQPLGSARYMGMCGAMTAIGGDASAVVDNPAGLGLYRRFEISLSGHQMWSYAQSQSVLRTRRFAVPQAGVVVPFGDKQKEKGFIFHQVMFAYNRLATLDQSVVLPSTSGSVNELDRGSVDQFSLLWGSNVSNQWYVGVGLNIPTISYSHTYTTPLTEQYHSISGAGFHASFGCIYRPCQWVRIGASYSTPSWMRCKVGDDYSYYLENQTLPMRVSVGAALQVLRYGMLSVQWDYAHLKSWTDQHSLRAGLEAQVYRALFVNAGYAKHFAFGSQYIGAALGYRGEGFVAQIGYQYRWKKMVSYTSSWTYTEPMDVYGLSHQMVVTLAWRI